MSRVGAFVAGGAVAAFAGAVFIAPIVMSAGSLFNTDLKNGIVPVSCGSAGTIQQVSRNTPKVAGWSAAQVGNASTIVSVGQGMKMPPRAWVVAVATAMQESTLHNYGDLGARNDHDSLGLFQQRPSQGWGAPEQTRDPVHASTKFYEHLREVGGWQSLSLTMAAQRVQRSAFPNAYAKWEDQAAKLVDTVSGGASKTPVTAQAIGKCATADEVNSGGWVRPVKAAVGSGFRTSDRPTHQGVDLMANKGTAIRAAAAGTVVHMECDRAEDGYDCNKDGSPSQPGCGWYVDIRHAGGIVTRYCHQLVRPLVDTGDKVTAGQKIGVVGTSGHSSGPHLHFEVHTNNDRSSTGAIDPVEFMKKHGAPLGEGAQAGEVSI